MNSLRKYYEKHPKFRNGMDVIGAKINSLGVIYWICAAIFISTVALSLFLRLPEELKIPVTAIVSTILTTLIIPFILNNTKIESTKPFFAVCRNIEKTPKLRHFRAIQKN